MQKWSNILKIRNKVQNMICDLFIYFLATSSIKAIFHKMKCKFTRKKRTSLSLKNERELMILWRKITRALKELYKKDNNKNNSNINKHL